jgi:hypothetical protein
MSTSNTPSPTTRLIVFELERLNVAKYAVPAMPLPMIHANASRNSRGESNQTRVAISHPAQRGMRHDNPTRAVFMDSSETGQTRYGSLSTNVRKSSTNAKKRQERGKEGTPDMGTKRVD